MQDVKDKCENGGFILHQWRIRQPMFDVIVCSSSISSEKSGKSNENLKSHGIDVVLACFLSRTYVTICKAVLTSTV